MKKKIIGLLVLSVIAVVAVIVSAQVFTGQPILNVTGAPIWQNPQGKQLFNHTHTIDHVHEINATGADNDWSFAGNNIYRLSDTVSIGAFPSGAVLLSALYVKNIAGAFPNTAQRIETTGNAMGLWINPLSGATGPALWANGRGRFEALSIGNIAGNDVNFNPGIGNLIVENNVGIGTTTPQSSLQISNGYLQLDLTTGTPPAGDCDQTSELGRMIVDPTATKLYVCVEKTIGIAWGEVTIA